MAYLPDIPGQKEIASFPWHAVKDDIIPSKTQPGDLVIPRQVMEQNPDIANLAKIAILQSGGLPSNYIAGDPNGMYNPYTGEQNFGFWKALCALPRPLSVLLWVAQPVLPQPPQRQPKQLAVRGKKQRFLLACHTLAHP